MRNIFLFIRRYFNFLFFLLLQVFSIYLIVHYDRYHNAVFSSTFNKATGKINEEYNRVEYYFRLKSTNDSLVKANERLYNKLKGDFLLPDTTTRLMIDSLNVDSLEKYRRYYYYSAKVVANSVSAQNNFIVIKHGTTQHLKKDMGVIDANNGVVGIITEVDGDYAAVMSLLHKDSHISGKLLHGGETGTLNWDGKEPNMLTLTGVAKSAKVNVGDTVITSGFSTGFPEGMLVGYIKEVIAEKSTNNYLLKLRSAANFYTLEFVFVVENKQAEHINGLYEKEKSKTQ